MRLEEEGAGGGVV
jgi:hypothetical protein